MQFDVVVGDDYKLTPTHYRSQFFKRELDRFIADHAPSGLLTVELKQKPTQRRSNAQNKWLWGAAYPAIADYLLETQGETYTHKDIHEMMLKALAPRVDAFAVINGKEMIYTDLVRSSAMSITQFAHYLDAIVLYWGNKGLEIPIPPPQEQ